MTAVLKIQVGEIARPVGAAGQLALYVGEMDGFLHAAGGTTAASGTVSGTASRGPYGAVAAPVATTSGTAVQLNYGGVTAPLGTTTGIGIMNASGGVTAAPGLASGVASREPYGAITAAAGVIGGYAQFPAYGGVTAARAEVTGIARAGVSAFGAITAPVALTAGIAGAQSGNALAPAGTIAGTATQTNRTTGAAVAARATVSGSAAGTLRGTGNALTTAARASGTAVQAIVANGQIVARAPAFYGAAVQTLRATGNAVAPTPYGAGAGFQTARATGSATGARAAVYGRLQIAAAPVSTELPDRVVATTVSTSACTEYTNFPFNSYAVFAGRHFGAGPDGISVIGEDDTDAGQWINAFARTGESDNGSSQIKRPRDVHIGYKSPSRMVFRVLADGTSHDYELPANKDVVRPHKQQLGRGIRARYYAYEVRNYAGQAFILDAIEVTGDITSRRV